MLAEYSGYIQLATHVLSALAGFSSWFFLPRKQAAQTKGKPSKATPAKIQQLENRIALWQGKESDVRAELKEVRGALTDSERERRNLEKQIAKLSPRQDAMPPLPSGDKKHPLTIPIGIDAHRRHVFANIADIPHLLIAGLPGSGKSNFINHILLRLIAKSPKHVSLALFDLKGGVELAPFDSVPHLAIPLADTAASATASLSWLHNEMTRRQTAIRAAGYRKLSDYLAAHPGEMPYLIAVIDEISELVRDVPDTISTLASISSLARATGIHLIIATQYPKAETLPTHITCNMGGILSFRLRNAQQSRVVLDEAGAEALTGRGQGLFSFSGYMYSVQTPFVSDGQIKRAISSCA